MTIMKRVIRIFRADMHGVMDQLEDRELLVRQYLREMEDDLQRKEALLKEQRLRFDSLQIEARTFCTRHSQRMHEAPGGGGAAPQLYVDPQEVERELMAMKERHRETGGGTC